MTLLIILFGILIAIVGMMLLIKPALIIEFLSLHFQSNWIRLFAIVVRAFLGLLLITHAGSSKFPAIIGLFGWLSLIAALTLLFMGRRHFQQLMSWSINIIKPYSPIGGLLSAAFGVFLVYAFI